MDIIKFILNWWYGRMRDIDLQILWPTCKRQAEENVKGEDALGDNPLEIAKAMFAMHAFHDKAWRVLGDEEIIRRIDNLT